MGHDDTRIILSLDSGETDQEIYTREDDEDKATREIVRDGRKEGKRIFI